MMNYKQRLDAQIIDAFIDPSATIGEGSVVWWYARVLAGVALGDRVSVGGGTEIGRNSVIGNDTRIGANAFLPPNSVLGERVFVGPGVVFTDDRHPKVPLAGDPPYTPMPPIVDDDAVIGARAVILPGVRIGRGAVIGAGAIVTISVAPGAFVRCEPGRPFDASPEASAAYRAHATRADMLVDRDM